MRLLTLVTGAMFFVMLGLLTVSYFLDGTAQVVCGAMGLLGAVALLPLFLYLLVAKPAPTSEGGSIPAPVPAKKDKQGRKADHGRQNIGGGGSVSGPHLPSRHGHSPHEAEEDMTQEKRTSGPKGNGPGAKHDKTVPPREGKGPHLQKRPDAGPSRKMKGARSKSVERPGRASEKKGILEKIEDKVGHHHEECPRCTNVIVITDKTRPLKTRCPKCNMIVVVK